MYTHKSSILIQDDAAIWLAFKNGSSQAFDYIYDTYFSKLYSYGMRFSSDKALIKDCIQNIFVELWRKKETLSNVQSIKFYLYKCLRRRIIHALVQEEKYVHDDELDEHYNFEVIFSHEFFLITRQISEENQERLTKAFELLTKRQREAVYLRYYDNLDYQQIALIMQLKDVKYARTLIYRALDVLKASIRRLASV